MKKVLTVLSTILLSAAMLAQNNISLPAGTVLKVKLENNLATFSSKSGDPFSGRVTEAVALGGKTVVPIGATVQGRVTQVSEPRRYTGKPTIGIFPETLVMPNGERFMLNATLVDTSVRRGTDVNSEGQFKGRGHDGKDLTEIGMGTGRRREGRTDRRHDRRHGDSCSLVGQEKFRHASGGNRASDGVEPSDGDDGGNGRTVGRQLSVKRPRRPALVR
jgi:hypothetical protein